MIKSGTQFWNAGKTQGYEFVRNVYDDMPMELQLSSYNLKPLGAAREPITGDRIPGWFYTQVRSSMGVTGK